MRGINKIFTDAKENMFESFLFWFLCVQSDSTYQPRGAERSQSIFPLASCVPFLGTSTRST